MESFFEFLNLSIFKLHSLYEIEVDFLQNGLIWKFHSCNLNSVRKTFDDDRSIQILMLQNFQKVVIENDSSRISKRCFSVTGGLIFFMNVTISNVKRRENNSVQFSVSWFFSVKIRSLPKIESIFFDVCRYSISYFSITKGLFSFSRVSIKSLNFFQCYSVRY